MESKDAGGEGRGGLLPFGSPLLWENQGLGDNQILTHEDWQLFGLTPDDVRDLLKRLSLQGLLILQSAGDVVHVGWTCKTLDELSDVITR